MSLQKTEAIVLRSQKLGETSKILTLFTRKFGKIKVIAKGARNSRSRFAGSLEPLNYVYIVFYQKENRDLQILSQADIIEAYTKTRKNLQKTTISMAACEIVDRLEIGVSPNPQLFRLLIDFLRSINITTERPINCFRAYQVHLFDIAGIKPDFTTCQLCKQQIKSECLFDISQGSVVCEKCVQTQASGIVLSENSIRALRIFQNSTFANLNNLLSDSSDEQQVDNLLTSYLKYHIEGIGDIRAYKFLKNIL